MLDINTILNQEYDAPSTISKDSPQKKYTSKPLHSKRTIGNSSSAVNTKKMIPIGEDFIPGPFDVICAKGSEARNHIGNITFRQKIKEQAEAYSKAPSKLYKSLVVSKVVNFFQQRNNNNCGPHGGGFVKEVNGMWYEVGEHTAREKTGQALRDQNHSMYKSSTKSKRRRWRQEKRENIMMNEKSTCATAPIPVNTFSHGPAVSTSVEKASQFICHQMDSIESQWENAGLGDDASDESILMMFTQNNMSILSSISKDPTLQAGIRALLG